MISMKKKPHNFWIKSINFDHSGQSGEKIGQKLMPIEYKEVDKDLQFGPTQFAWWWDLTQKFSCSIAQLGNYSYEVSKHM